MLKFKYKDVATISKTGAGEAKLVMEVLAADIAAADAVFEATHGPLKKYKTIALTIEEN